MSFSNNIVLVCGKMGAGKSVYCQRLFDLLGGSKIVIDTQQEYEKEAYYFYSLKDLIEWYVNNKDTEFSAICRFQSDEEIDKLFEFCHIVGRLTIFADELGLYTDSENFFRLVQLARHRQVNIICCTQRPYEIPVRLKTNCKAWVVFKMTEPTDLQYFTGTFGASAYELKDLPDFIYSQNNLKFAYKFFGKPEFCNILLDKIE